MIELQFIDYLIKISKKFDTYKYKYYPNYILRDKYTKNLCKKFNIENNSIITLEINLLENYNKIIKYLKKKVLIIKKINKKYVLCPTVLLSDTYCHSYLIVYYKNKNKFYICDSFYFHYDEQTISGDKLKKIYDCVFDCRYEIYCQYLQCLEEDNNYVKYLKNEYSNGYCLAWTYLLCHLIIQYHWCDLKELIDSMIWNLEFSSRFARYLIRGFIVHNIHILYNK